MQGDWPKPTVLELARIAAALSSRPSPHASDEDECDRARRALRLVWECAFALRDGEEEAQKLLAHFQRHTEKKKALAALLDFDPHKQTYPLSHADFLKLLNLKPIKVGKRYGVEGRELWREFLRKEFLAKRIGADGEKTVRESADEATVDAVEERHEREGWKEAEIVEYTARRFFYWRAQLVRANRPKFAPGEKNPRSKKAEKKTKKILGASHGNASGAQR